MSYAQAYKDLKVDVTKNGNLEARQESKLIYLWLMQVTVIRPQILHDSDIEQKITLK